MALYLFLHCSSGSHTRINASICICRGVIKHLYETMYMCIKYGACVILFYKIDSVAVLTTSM